MKYIDFKRRKEEGNSSDGSFSCLDCCKEGYGVTISY